MTIKIRHNTRLPGFLQGESVRPEGCGMVPWARNGPFTPDGGVPPASYFALDTVALVRLMGVLEGMAR